MIRRRSALAAIGTLLSAGCLQVSDSTTAPIGSGIVMNFHTEPHDFSVTIECDDTRVYGSTFRLEPATEEEPFISEIFHADWPLSDGVWTATCVLDDGQEMSQEAPDIDEPAELQIGVTEEGSLRLRTGHQFFTDPAYSRALPANR